MFAGSLLILGLAELCRKATAVATLLPAVGATTGTRLYTLAAAFAAVAPLCTTAAAEQYVLRRYSEARQQGDVLRTLKSASVSHCAHICTLQPQCVAVNAERAGGCELMRHPNVSIESAVASQEWQHFTTEPFIDYGCYREDHPRVMQHGYTTHANLMTPALCYDFCKPRSVPYFGLQYGVECFCGVAYATYGPATNCNMTCPGNTKEMCGGNYALTTYAILPWGFI